MLAGDILRLDVPVTKFDIVVKFELASIALLVGKIDRADVPDASELAGVSNADEPFVTSARSR